MQSSTDKSHLLPVYARSPLQFVKGQGSWLIEKGGGRYLDFGSGVAVNALGHNFPQLVAALKQQADNLWHVSNLFTIPEQEKFARELCEASFADKVFFCNSGAEAVEGVIKNIRKFHAHNKNSKITQGGTKSGAVRDTIITFKGAFHGRSLATLAAAGNPDYLDGFGTPLAGFCQIDGFDISAVARAIDKTTAGILIEPIQGEGGVRDCGTHFLRELRKLCDKHGLLLGLDEVQCGYGRTGKLFAHEWAGIAPDVMAIAKGIGGGFPLGGVLATDFAAQGMVAGTHGSTYGGNPLAMAVGMTVLKTITARGFLDNVNDLAGYLRQRLSQVMAEYPDVICEIRGVGLMVGLKCKIANTALVDALRDEKLLSVSAGENTVRLLPPLTVAREELDIAMKACERACKRLQGRLSEAEAKTSGKG